MKGKFIEQDGELRLVSVVSDKVLKSGNGYLRQVDEDKVNQLIDQNFDKESYSHPESVFYNDHYPAIYIEEESETAELKFDQDYKVAE